MKHQAGFYDILVVGGGHAGVEAALICGKMGLSVGLVTIDPLSLGRMSCNPAIGGLAKGQLVREIDVLGGVMARITDLAGLQYKMLNKSKGRAVWSPRAQVDKRKYEKEVSRLVLKSEGVSVLRGEASEIIINSGRVEGVVLVSGRTLSSSSVVLTCGTFLGGLIHVGDKKIPAGRMGELHSGGITQSLVDAGFKAGRLKTGTPPRLKASTVDWKQCKKVEGDSFPVPFSHFTKDFSPPNVPCFLAKTNEKSHDIIRKKISLSPMFSGDIGGVGPRYCPSIEDKIYRFAEKSEHFLYLEPEWLGSDQIYLNGFSTSLPEEDQLRSLRAVSGLGSVEFFRPGYAIEYDFFPPSQLKASLETKNVQGLFFAGQINGTSGYEEAAGQGLLAGINAGMRALSRGPLILSRESSYLGVMVDDLITKDTLEPYRMFTSRAEARLLLRYSNADVRLLKQASSLGLLSTEEIDHLKNKIHTTETFVKKTKETQTPKKINPILLKRNESVVNQGVSLFSILKRPSIKISDFRHLLFIKNENLKNFAPLFEEAFMEAETSIKYDGYIKRQQRQIEKVKALHNKKIPTNFNYKALGGLSSEATEKLSQIKPETLGQAGRVSGVTPSDLSVLSVFLFK